MEKITFSPDGKEPVDFYVLEQTTISGKTYFLVTDAEEGDGDAYIIRDDSAAEDEEGLYCFVEEDQELSAIGAIFQKLLDEDGVDLEV